MDQARQGGPSEVVSLLTELLEISESGERPTEQQLAAIPRLEQTRPGRFPDFLGIGAQKAGTTWLHQCLALHPDVWMPKEKELHYFDEKFARSGTIERPPAGKDSEAQRWRRQLRRQLRSYQLEAPNWKDVEWDLRYFLGDPSNDWYASLFSEALETQITGEFTPEYSAIPVAVIKRISEIMPKVKIVFFMRHPVERAWSQTSMRIRSGDVDFTPEDVEEHLLSSRSRSFTDYLSIIDNWAHFFSQGQVFIGFLEDLAFFPDALLQRLHRFLGVADRETHSAVLTRRVHSGNIETIPVRYARLLARHYLPMIEDLADRFGGYATGWLQSAISLAEMSLDAEPVRYPLWSMDDSKQGHEPFGGSIREMQSGELKGRWV